MFLGSTGLFSKDKVSWALPQNLTEIKTQIPNFVGMNFLAHIYLSGTDEELTLGNFFADSLKGKSYLKYPLGIQRGVVLHRAIDFYTDTHPTVRKSISRLFETCSHTQRNKAR